MWLEKAINRGDVDKGDITFRKFHDIFDYQRISNYFKKDTEIEYIGKRVRIMYNRKTQEYPIIELIDGHDYQVPKIMYMPSERNLLSTIENAFGLKNLPDNLHDFAEEMRRGQLELKENLLELPIGNVRYRFDKETGSSFIVGNDFELDLLESSSGFQSLVPMYLVAKFLTNELGKDADILREQLNVEQSVRRNREIAAIMFSSLLTSDEKNIKVEEIDKRYLNTSFVNIVEEPEQNLYPTSQQQVLYRLLELNNMNINNKLLITTHSPYMINFLTLAVEANGVKAKPLNDKQKGKLNAIVPLNVTIDPKELVVYELDERNGSISKLDDYHGLPSDGNKLNHELSAGNDAFIELLELQRGL
jgi:hypothetical protein